MSWWNDFVTWFNSASGSRIFLSVILPFAAIVLAGVVAAAIGRYSARRVLDHEQRELKSSALIALIVVGRKASIWSSLGADQKQHVDGLMSEADIRIRLLPVSGAGQAADWAAHQLADMKKNSASFSFQAEQTFVDYRDRLLDWQNKPARAKKLFTSDLQQWHYEDDSPQTASAQEWTPATVLPPTATVATETVATARPTATPGLATAPPPRADSIVATPPSGIPTPPDVTPTPPGETLL